MTDFRLETFVCLCETMNYRAAAEKLNITQPAVSQHIRALEQHYKCRLFIYDRRKLSMTPQAKLLLRHAQTVLRQEQKLLEALTAAPARTLRIGATKTIGEYVIAEQVSRFLQQPANRISVNVDNTRHLLRLLHQP